MADIDTRKIDYVKVRALFQVDDNAPHEPNRNDRKGPAAPPQGKSWFSGSESRLTRLWHSLSSKWPGWPGFWQSRFSGVPVALIFGLYVYYLLVFVMLPTNVEAETDKQMSNINASEVISKIKYLSK